MIRFITFFLFVLIFLFPFHVTASETFDDDNHKSTQSIKGQSIIFLDEEIQKTSGIKTIQLQSVNFQPEFISYGKAINISPLLKVQHQYLSASTKQIGAKARFNQSVKNISRLRDLHQNEAISTRKLQTQQSQWQSDKAIVNELNHLRKIIIAHSNIQWGEKLTQWATGTPSPQFDSLMSGNSTLLKITLPSGASIPAETKTLFINQRGNRDRAFKAFFVTQLPQADPVTQGLQYAFIADRAKIKPGMNFSAWIPFNGMPQQGIIIPKASLGWHLGQAFVFIKTDEEQFIHQNISNPITISNGYFITEGIEEGDEIVVTGTQMLLSHEFRSQIPDEDDDDD